MNLLLINYEYPPIGGGAANATWNLATALNESGNHVTVLTAAYRDLKGWRNENGVNVFRCRAIRKKQATSTILEMLSFVVSAALTLPRIVKSKNIEGVIAFFLFPCGPLGLIAHFFYRIPYLVSLRGGDVPGTEPGLSRIHRLLMPIRKLVYRKSAGVIANSIGLKALAQKCDDVEIDVIPNGVDTEFFQPASLRQETGTPAFQFLFVGRFQPQKNLSFFFHRIAELCGKTSVPFVIHMVGEGPQKGKLEKLAQTLGINDKIQWHGWLEPFHLREMYQSADCLVLPSLYEGMPNVILEAMACGVPILASRVEGNVDLVKDGHTGYVFKPNSPQAFRSAFNAMVDMPEKTKQMGRNARQFVDGHFNWLVAAKKYYVRLSGFHCKRKNAQSCNLISEKTGRISLSKP